MHLSDDQLIERNEDSQPHLQQCDLCQKRLADLTTFRKRLQELPESKAPQDFWQQIKRQHYSELEQKQASNAKKQIRFWRYSSIALAASLVIALVVQISFSSTSLMAPNQQSTQIALLIEQNRLLQQQLSSSTLQTNVSQTSVVKLQLNLLEIDRLLQSAYELDLPDEDKEKLWRQRQQLIESSLTKNKQPKILRI